MEKRESELKRLRAEQYKTLQDEVFGGLSPAEQAEYNRKSERIHELESKIQNTHSPSLGSSALPPSRKGFEGQPSPIREGSGKAQKSA
jgi:hypothetical protein